MKDHNLLTQKLALIASNSVLSDTVVSALDDAVALLNEYRDEIDKLRRHNASLISNGIQDAMHKDEIVSNTLKNARIKIEQAGQRGQKEQYHVSGEYGDHGWLHYCKGIRDACWAIDKLIDGYQRHEISEETTLIQVMCDQEENKVLRCKICGRMKPMTEATICDSCKDAMKRNGYIKVLRCKNCKWYSEKGFCKHPNGGSWNVRPADWYCADGERKVEDD